MKTQTQTITYTENICDSPEEFEALIKEVSKLLAVGKIQYEWWVDQHGSLPATGIIIKWDNGSHVDSAWVLKPDAMMSPKAGVFQNLRALETYCQTLLDGKVDEDEDGR